jgi:signal peptidase I
MADRLLCGPQLDQQPVQTVRVPSASMEPTLRVGEIVTVNNTAMRARPPAIGDIVVMHPSSGADPAVPTCGDGNQGIDHSQACDDPTPSESSQTFIKRVVAGPGDTISIVNGHVIRNGVREPDPYIEPRGNDASVCSFPEPIVSPRRVSTTYSADNRGQSADSRFWGPAERSSILGLVETR